MGNCNIVSSWHFFFHLLLQFSFSVIAKWFVVNFYFWKMKKKRSCDALIMTYQKLHFFFFYFLCLQLWMKRADSRMLTCSCLDDTGWKCKAINMTINIWYCISLSYQLHMWQNFCDTTFVFHFLKALITLKKGSKLIKYSRKGKPKIRSFRLSSVSS